MLGKTLPSAMAAESFGEAWSISLVKVTGVFVNGRNIAYNELVYLQTLAQGQIAPGQYWLDATGNAGQVGGPALINFLYAAQAVSAGGGTNTWYGSGSAGWSSSDGSGGVWISNPYGGTGTTVTH